MSLLRLPLPVSWAILSRHDRAREKPARRPTAPTGAGDRHCQRRPVDGADCCRQRADVRLHPGPARRRRLRSDLGRADRHRSFGRRSGRLYPDRAAGAQGRARSRVHGAVGVDRAVQRRRRRRSASVAVDRGACALRLCHMRPVHRGAELAERCRRQCHTRQGHGGVLRLLCRRARRRLRRAGRGRYRNGAGAVDRHRFHCTVDPSRRADAARPAAGAAGGVGCARPGLADFAGRRRRHAGRRRAVDGDFGFRADPCHGQGLQPGRRGIAAVGDAGRHADPADPARLDFRPHRPALCADRRFGARRCRQACLPSASTAVRWRRWS